MYPSYNDPYHNGLDIAARAAEGDAYHVLLQSGSVTLNATANTLSTASVTFSRPFTEGTTPDVVYSLKTVGDTTSTIKFTDITATDNKGFTLRAMTDITQALVFSWIAKGIAS